MSTKKNRLVMVRIRIGFFALPIILPLRCLHEVLEGFCDFLSLFKWIGGKAYVHLQVAQAALLMLKEHGPLDFVDVDVKSPEARVKIKILMR